MKNKLGDKRKTFAFLPKIVYKYSKNGPFIEKYKTVWLKTVIEMWTMNGWIVYLDYNENLK